MAGTGFGPNQPLIVEVMETADPSAGPALLQRATTASAAGDFVEVFDVPPTPGASPVMRSVRARSGLGFAPSLLATAPLRSVSRAVQVTGDAATADSTQHWELTGLPPGTAMYAHYRHGGHTVASTFLGTADDLCGRLSFDLRTLPRGFGHRGGWDVWMTADRTYRRPLKGVYVHRHLTAEGPDPESRVRAGAVTSRLAALDPRLTGPVTNGMGADATQIGLISLVAVDMVAPVTFFERVGDRLAPLGTGTALPGDPRLALLKDATSWSCDRQVRNFVAAGTRHDGGLALATYSVRTPSCLDRFELSVPRRVAAGKVASVRIKDRWALGAITPSLCVTGPGARRGCRRVALGAGIAVARRRFRARAHGSWLVQLLVRDRSVARAVVAVGPSATLPTPAPTLLATGDSTMQGIDGFLGDELGEAVSVVSDVRIGAGLSVPAAVDEPASEPATAFRWANLARTQTARLHQQATVISLGANEGFDMTTPAGTRVVCCDPAWTAEYTRRVGVVMDTYARGGRARVLWLTIPLPRVERRSLVVRAVNPAILAAAAGRPNVQVVRLDLVFTPDGYRDVIRYRGRDVSVRDADGVHLNAAGTAIAARIVAQALRAR